jgi:hypothetical protein
MRIKFKRNYEYQDYSEVTSADTEGLKEEDRKASLLVSMIKLHPSACE